MALYTIGEVALLCDINPVTLRAWQRRYGLLKPQRTDGGHRLFNDADIDRIREIKRWIDNGVQVSKVKMLLSNENVDVQNGWRDQQETLLTYLQSGNLHSLRTWIKERGQDYPAQTLTTHLFIPLRRRAILQRWLRSCNLARSCPPSNIDVSRRSDQPAHRRPDRRVSRPLPRLSHGYWQ